MYVKGNDSLKEYMSFLIAKNFQRINGECTCQNRQVYTQRTVRKKSGEENIVKRQHELFVP